MTGYRTARRLLGAGATYSTGGFGFLDLRRLSPPSRKISEFSTNRSAIAVAMVVLKRMLPQSEKAVFVVIMADAFVNLISVSQARGIPQHSYPN